MTENERRLEREKKIAHKVVDCLLEAGYAVEVYDGEETALAATTDRAAIKKAMMTTDEDYLFAHKEGEEGPASWVRLIYGNDTDLISDYNVSLEPVIQPAIDFAETL